MPTTVHLNWLTSCASSVAGSVAFGTSTTDISCLFPSSAIVKLLSADLDSALGEIAAVIVSGVAPKLLATTNDRRRLLTDEVFYNIILVEITLNLLAHQPVRSLLVSDILQMIDHLS